MTFTDGFIQQLRDRVDIIDEIGQVVNLKKQGKNYFACCPFHDEKTPSFSVTAEKQLYFCHGACGEGGDVIDFIQKYYKVGFSKAISILAERAGIPLEDTRTADQLTQGSARVTLYNVTDKAKSYYQNQLTAHKKAQEFLRRRGISVETVDKFAIGAVQNNWRDVIDAINPDKHFRELADSGLAVYEPKTTLKKGRFYDRFRDGVIFPIRDEKGRVASFGKRRLSDTQDPGGKTPPKYINGPETEIFKKSSIAYGLYEALQSNCSLTHLMGFYALLVNFNIASITTSLCV